MEGAGARTAVDVAGGFTELSGEGQGSRICLVGGLQKEKSRLKPICSGMAPEERLFFVDGYRRSYGTVQRRSLYLLCGSRPV